MIDRAISSVSLEVDVNVYCQFITSRNFNTVKEFEQKYGIVATTNNRLYFDTEEHKTLFLMTFA